MQVPISAAEDHVTTDQMTTRADGESESVSGERRGKPRSPTAIQLRLAGGDLLLSGRFEQWIPLVMENEQGEGGDQGTVRILFDVTSTAAAEAGRGDKNFFSFSSRTVKRLGPQAYSAKGTLRVGGASRALEVLLHSPVAHTPFFTLTVPIDKSRFGALWTEIERRIVDVAAHGETEMRPRAWLRAPVVAAA
jgi:hypothetical protein